MILVIILGLAALYWPAFTSPFFQDDAILSQIARTQSVFSVTPNFPYRPVAIQIFYGLSDRLFGQNVFGYHLILFLALVLTVVVIYRIAKIIFVSEKKALLTAFFYAFNVSIFALPYWTAVSYFSLGALFFFATVYFYLRGKTTWVIVFFLLALGSNEIAVVLPVLLAAVSWYQKKWFRSLAVLTLLDGVLLAGRVLFIGLPQDSAYNLSINLQVLSTVRWYFLRALNLPEGIRFAADPLILVLFSVFLVIITLGIKPTRRLLVFGLVWFITGALPFYFLPNHMSAYYLTMALFGPAVILGEVFSGKKLAWLAVAVYFLLTVRGLDFLSGTHWIILKNTGPIGRF